ncbi:uncharacterized protein F4817DRAFT_325139 [Daldinia loculata]|uniref:uncharacterized protein n=1 Tax=Daldinia loculata TaxID=103429 RepID=UPI0020C233E8|nr:uncharacterized protein F4817DRAFT_325139 [Daldinia loculata]KAI1651098.1 hypothetical protein F4817DRAFT_325139 [Daldinia loculata]
MPYKFPKAISAVRVATFVSTAAWIQGTSASEVSLPEEALNNFLRRHRVINTSRRQAPAPEEEKEDEKEEEEEEGEESSDSESSGSSDSKEEGEKEEKEEEEDDAPSISDPAQAGIALGPAGRPAIGTTEPPGSLSVGARVAIGVWSAVGVLAIFGLAFFFCRRRRRARMAQEEMNALRDEELARSHQEHMSQISMPLPPPPRPPPPPAPPMMEQAHLRSGSDAGNVRPPSGEWMATPPWQEDPPTWRDSHPWRQSQPSVAGGVLAGGPRPLFAPPNTKPEYDRRTEVTGETESTIFAYR